MMAIIDGKEQEGRYQRMLTDDQACLMEALDEAILSLQDSLAQNVRQEQQLNRINEMFGIPEDAVRAVDYYHAELRILPGYQSYVKLWCGGEDPFEGRYYKRLIQKLHNGTDITSDAMGQGYMGSGCMEKARTLADKMLICTDQIEKGLPVIDDYRHLHNELMDSLMIYENEVDSCRSLVRELIFERDEIEDKSDDYIYLLSAIYKELSKNDISFSPRLSALLNTILASETFDNICNK